MEAAGLMLAQLLQAGLGPPPPSLLLRAQTRNSAQVDILGTRLPGHCIIPICAGAQPPLGKSCVPTIRRKRNFKLQVQIQWFEKQQEGKST